MNAIPVSILKPESTRIKLLSAALGVIRNKGYSATSVDELCAAAGVSKGSFFHNFPSKEALAIGAVKHWSNTTGLLFEAAHYHKNRDPLDRVLGYVDFRLALIDGPVEAFTCLVGTIVQEAFNSSDAIRAACDASISEHAKTLENDLSEVLAQRRITHVSAQSLALHTQAVLQGAFILAKAKGGPVAARESVTHLKRYLELLLKPTRTRKGT